MVWLAPEQQYWIIEPLLDAGLELDQIRDLVFRLGFDSVVTEGAGTLAGLTSLVEDQPSDVQAAWAQAIGRMLTVGTDSAR